MERLITFYRGKNCVTSFIFRVDRTGHQRMTGHSVILEIPLDEAYEPDGVNLRYIMSKNIEWQGARITGIRFKSSSRRFLNKIGRGRYCHACKVADTSA